MEYVIDFFAEFGSLWKSERISGENDVVAELEAIVRVEA